jgi:hypothetical protein
MTMPSFICTSCGTQYAESATPRCRCAICEADGRRAPIAWAAWTTLGELRSRHHNQVRQIDSDLFGVRSIPTWAMGQRALLLRSPRGNVLWDCITLIDDRTVRLIRGLGGIAAIAVSHPRHLSSVVEWSHAFGGAPVHLHTADRRWVTRPDAVLNFWDGERLQLDDGITLLHYGGYFDGGTILHWPSGAKGKGTLLTGDIVQVVHGNQQVSFLSSSPGLIPRSPRAVEHIVTGIEPFSYDCLYDAWSDYGIARGARTVVIDSYERYVSAICAVDERGCDLEVRQGDKCVSAASTRG